jgi:hypothetical protein
VGDLPTLLHITLYCDVFSDYRRGFGFVIGFVAHLQLVTTSNPNAAQITATHVSLLSMFQLLPGYSLVQELHFLTADTILSSNQRQSHVTTDGQSTSLSWYQAPSGLESAKIKVRVML